MVGIAGVVGWQLPPARNHLTPVSVVVNSIAAPPSAGLPSINPRAKRGFTLVNPRERFAGKPSSMSLRADTEAKVRSMVTRLNESINLPVEIQISFEDCHDT